jgi:hypothetical protein
VGHTVGVAPEADLYYIAEQHGEFRPGQGFDWDFTPLATSIDRLLAVNAGLPQNRRIRVISISVGWSPGQRGYLEAMSAVNRATQAGVFVLSTALEQTHQVAFHGMGRDSRSDPDAFESYGPGSWWAQQFWSDPNRFSPRERLMVPMDSRATASPTGRQDYAFYPTGGWSWCVPWIAGLYALACQVDPDITPEVFWARALETGRIIHVNKETRSCEFGTIVDPIRLIRPCAPEDRAR